VSANKASLEGAPCRCRGYHLLAYHGNWYVLARSRGSEKTFALSRLGKVSPTWKRFKPPAVFDLRDFSREAFGIAHGEAP